MKPQSLSVFKRKIFIYSFFFIFFAALAMLMGLYQNMKTGFFLLEMNSLNYYVKKEGATINVRSVISCISPHDTSVPKTLIFPLLLPKNAELESFSVTHNNIKVNAIVSDGKISWESILPEKGESIIIYIDYAYNSPIPKIILPLNETGVFQMKNTEVMIFADADEKVYSFDSNYELTATYKGFATSFQYSGFFPKKGEDMLLNW